MTGNEPRAHGGESGGALVEFAALTTILTLLLFGGIDFGKFAYDEIVLGNAAQAGVQYGAQTRLTAADAAGMESVATTDATGVNLSGVVATDFCTCSDGTSSGTTIACSTSATPCGSGLHELLFVQVVTTGTFAPVAAFPGIPTISLSRTAVMPVSP